MLIKMSTIFNFYLKANGSTTTKVYVRGGCGKRGDRKVGGGLLSKPQPLEKIEIEKTVTSRGRPCRGCLLLVGFSIKWESLSISTEQLL